MKKGAILAFLLFATLTCFAQKLTSEEKIVFDQVAYTRRAAGEYEKISKWIIPIRYQIYGDTAAYLVKEIDSTFAALERMTNLDIQKTKDNDDANFIIVLGTKEKVEVLTSGIDKVTNSMAHFRYKRSQTNEIYRMEQIFFTEKFNDRPTLRAMIKRNIVKSFGFFTETPLLPNSIFYIKSGLKLKIDDFDGHLISALYLPEIKSGMTKDEVDKILGF